MRSLLFGGGDGGGVDWQKSSTGQSKAGLELGVVAVVVLPDAAVAAAAADAAPDDGLPDGDDDSYWIETNRMVIVHLNDGVYV